MGNWKTCPEPGCSWVIFCGKKLDVLPMRCVYVCVDPLSADVFAVVRDKLLAVLTAFSHPVLKPASSSFFPGGVFLARWALVDVCSRGAFQDCENIFFPSAVKAHCTHSNFKYYPFETRKVCGRKNHVEPCSNFTLLRQLSSYSVNAIPPPFPCLFEKAISMRIQNLILSDTASCHLKHVWICIKNSYVYLNRQYGYMNAIFENFNRNVKWQLP